jgi:hypothetical protein
VKCEFPRFGKFGTSLRPRNSEDASVQGQMHTSVQVDKTPSGSSKQSVHQTFSVFSVHPAESLIHLLVKYHVSVWKGDRLRPIVWGLIISVLGGFFWILFSVVFGITAGLSGRDIGAGYQGLIYITGLSMIFGIPAGLIGEIIRWLRAKKSERK